MGRTFEDKPATRESVPLLVGLVGPSGGGKTFSALRLATGMQRVTGGEIFFIDTESRRALHYADDFNFRHIEMGSPFSSIDYLEAIQHCKRQKSGVLIVDSMSHEHEGPGGYLDTHETELQRMAGDNYKKRERMTFSAWIKPSQERRKLINEVLRMGVSAIFCFRSKEKIKIVSGQNPIQLGWQPIAGDEFVYEMTVNCLLYPAAKGVPAWNPAEVGERVMIKRPEKLAHVFKDGQPISEDTGEALAIWAAGDGPTPISVSIDDVVAGLEACETTEELDAARAKWWKTRSWSESEIATLVECVDAIRARLTDPPADDEPEPEPDTCCPYSDEVGDPCLRMGAHDRHATETCTWDGDNDMPARGAS